MKTHQTFTSWDAVSCPGSAIKPAMEANHLDDWTTKLRKKNQHFFHPEDQHWSKWFTLVPGRVNVKLLNHWKRSLICIFSSCFCLLVGGFSPIHLKKIWVKMGIIPPQISGWWTLKKYVETTLRHFGFCLGKISRKKLLADNFVHHENVGRLNSQGHLWLQLTPQW